MAEAIVQVTEGSGKKLHTWDRTVGANLVQDEYVQTGEFGLATYSLRTGGIATTTADSHMLQIMAGTTLPVYVRRIRAYQFAAATTAAFVLWDVVRLSTAGTGGTAVTPAPHDSTDAASGAAGMTLPTVKGTETTTVASLASYFTQTPGAAGMPQITTVADFDFTGLHGKSLRIPAGTANGIAFKLRTAVAGAQVIILAEIVEATF